jgi:tRNA A-37 threonylcarbamoyl transferase component Bud32
MMNQYQYLQYQNILRRLVYQQQQQRKHNTNLIKSNSQQLIKLNKITQPVKKFIQINNYCDEKDLENYDLIKEKRNEVMKKLLELKDNNKILLYLNSLPDIYKFNSEHTLSEKVSMIEGFIVKKTCQYSSFGNYVFWNEVKALYKLRGYPHFPYIYAYDPNKLIIYMSYCGKLISSGNLPTNWKEQITDISLILKTLNVNSNDMLLRNICCLNGEIKIIDFGLSTIFGKTIDDVLKDLYNNLNTLNKNISITPNIQSYIYINEYPNWRQNLENYKIKEIQLALIKKQLIEQKNNKIKNHKK